MSAIATSPNLAQIVRNAALDSIAPDPGALAAGAIVTPIFSVAKRLRCGLVTELGGTTAEIETSATILHTIEHNQLGVAAAGNKFRVNFEKFLHHAFSSGKNRDRWSSSCLGHRNSTEPAYTTARYAGSSSSNRKI